MRHRSWQFALLAVLFVSLAALLIRRSPPSPRPSQPVSAASHEAPLPASPSLSRAPTQDSQPRTQTHAEVLLRLDWGHGPRQLARTQAAEGNAEGPMSFARGPHGEVCILDQLNARVLCFDVSGHETRSVALPSRTAQDLVVADDGSIAVLDRLGSGRLTVFRKTQGSGQDLSLDQGPIREAGTMTALLLDPSGHYLIENEHDKVFRMADAAAKPLPQPEELPGRPMRDGSGFINAALQDGKSGLVTLWLYRTQGQVQWQHELSFAAPILQIMLLDSDRQGWIYLAALIKTSGDAGTLIRVLRLTAEAGAIASTLDVPAPSDPYERFRELVVTPDGELLQFQASPAKARVLRYSFDRDPVDDTR